MNVIARNVWNRSGSPSLHPIRGARLFAMVLAVALVLAACARASSPEESQKDNGTRSAASADVGADAQIRKVTRRQWDAMVDAGMVRPECPIQRPAALRVVEVNHLDFNGDIKRGRLVVNADVAESVARIFSELYDEQFPIRRMEPVEAFNGDTNLSLAADNTSAFNCRRADQINAPFALRRMPTAGRSTSTLARIRGVTCAASAGSRVRRTGCGTPSRGRSRREESCGEHSGPRGGSGRTSTFPTTCTSTPAIPRGHFVGTRVADQRGTIWRSGAKHAPRIRFRSRELSR